MQAFARVKKIRNMAGLVSAERHARRQDNSKHINADRTHLNKASGYQGVDDPLSIVEAFKARKRDAGASERKGASLALHLILGVSPEWIAEAGDVHDPQNPRNRALFDSAKHFMEEKFGKGSVIHTRMDMDEAGSAVVDVIVVPVVEYQQRGKTKRQVSANSGLEAAFGRGRNYRRIQDKWAEHCKKTLDARIERGQHREETQRDHVHHSVYRPMMERAAVEAQEIKENVAKETRAELTKEWEAAGWTGRREKALEAARDAAYAEGQASMKPWANRRANRAKAKAEKEKEAALKRKDDEWRGKVTTIENEVAVARDHLREAVEERDAMAVEVDGLRSENSDLKREVSGLRRIVKAIYEKAPAPVKRFIDALTREQKAPAPSAPSRQAGQGRGGAPLAGQAQGEGVGMDDPGKRTPSPF